MDPNPMPWRVLEDPVVVPPGGALPDPPAGSRAAFGRSTLIVGAAAIVLAVGAFVLASGTGSDRSVIVDGASALPGSDPSHRTMEANRNRLDEVSPQ